MIEFLAFMATGLHAVNIDEKALNTIMRSHDVHADAVTMYETTLQKANISLAKLVNRKKAILSGRMNDFLSVYQQIREINFNPGEGIIELFEDQLFVDRTEGIQEMVASSMKPMSEKELFVTYLISPVGMAGAILKEAKRNEKMAKSQLREAFVLSDQANLIGIALDAITQRADQFSEMLAKFGVLFEAYIDKTNQIISKNGTERKNYSKGEREVLMNCVNFAVAVKAILDIPILGKDGNVTQEAIAAIEDGEKRLIEFKAHI